MPSAHKSTTHAPSTNLVLHKSRLSTNIQKQLNSTMNTVVYKQTNKTKRHNRHQNHTSRSTQLLTIWPSYLVSFLLYLFVKLFHFSQYHTTPINHLQHTISGRSDRNRTRNLRFWRPALYQLSYTPIISHATNQQNLSRVANYVEN